MTTLLSCLSQSLCCICSCLMFARHVNDATSAVPAYHIHRVVYVQV